MRVDANGQVQSSQAENVSKFTLVRVKYGVVQFVTVVPRVECLDEGVTGQFRFEVKAERGKDHEEDESGK